MLSEPPFLLAGPPRPSRDEASPMGGVPRYLGEVIAPNSGP